MRASPMYSREISIHALREEGDIVNPYSFPSFSDFYPRPPRGGRRAAGALFVIVNAFLSTPSARRATFVTHDQAVGIGISIHALREEGDHSI